MSTISKGTKTRDLQERYVNVTAQVYVGTSEDSVPSTAKAGILQEIQSRFEGSSLKLAILLYMIDLSLGNLTYIGSGHIGSTTRALTIHSINSTEFNNSWDESRSFNYYCDPKLYHVTYYLELDTALFPGEDFPQCCSPNMMQMISEIPSLTIKGYPGGSLYIE